MTMTVRLMFQIVKKINKNKICDLNTSLRCETTEPLRAGQGPGMTVAHAGKTGIWKHSSAGPRGAQVREGSGAKTNKQTNKNALHGDEGPKVGFSLFILLTESLNRKL